MSLSPEREKELLEEIYRLKEKLYFAVDALRSIASEAEEDQDYYYAGMADEAIDIISSSHISSEVTEP